MFCFLDFTQITEIILSKELLVKLLIKCYLFKRWYVIFLVIGSVN